MLFQTLLIYTSFIAVLLINGLQVEQKRRTLALSNTPFTNKVFFRSAAFMFLFFAILVGMRYDVGADHMTYWILYLEGGSGRFEFLFQFISSICRTIGLHPTIYFGILGLIQIVFLYLAFKDESYLFPFFAIFLFTDGLFGSWVNTIRQDIACCIWIFALNFIIKKKPFHYFLLCFLAFLFHRSAIILAILYPVFRNGKDYIHNIPVQLIIVVAAFLIRGRFGTILVRLDNLISIYSNFLFLGSDSGHYSAYSMDSMLDEVGQHVGAVRQSGIGVVVKNVSYICIVLFSNKIKAFFKSPKLNVIYTLFFISYISYIVLPEGVWGLARPFQYLICTRMIMLSYLCYYLFRSKNSYNLVIGTLVVVTQLILLYATTIISSQSVYYHGYQLFFQH